MVVTPTPKAPSFLAPELLQLRVFGFGFSQDGDVRVGVLPDREEVVIRRFCFCHVDLHGIRSTDLKMRECADGLIDDKSAMVEDFLKLGPGFRAPMCCQISFPAQVEPRAQSSFSRPGSGALAMTTFQWFPSLVLAATIVPALAAETHCPGNAASLLLHLVDRHLFIVALA
jgi:hypothetical protein